MVDVEYLSRLISVLKNSGVQSFKTSGVELTFAAHAPIAQSTPTPATQTIDLEGQLPVDLRSDAIADHDKVLNWSAPPSPQDIPTPGADDLPLTLAGGTP